MSHTDRHRPYWVQVADPWEKNKVRPEMWGMPRPYGWDYELLHKTCGCRMCGRDAFQVPERRQQRLRGRRQLRRWMRGADSWD